MSDLLKFFKLVRRLSSIERCSNTPHIHRSLVSDHSYYVALYAMTFADIENIKLLNENMYDTSEVIKRALVHDLEESITGDVLYPLKHDKNLNTSLKETISKVVRSQLFKNIPEKSIRKYYKVLWRDSKDNSKEGRLVAAMDKFEILMYAIEELSLGNKQFAEIYETCMEILTNDFKSIESLQEVLICIKREVNKYLDKTYIMDNRRITS